MRLYLSRIGNVVKIRNISHGEESDLLVIPEGFPDGTVVQLMRVGDMRVAYATTSESVAVFDRSTVDLNGTYQIEIKTPEGKAVFVVFDIFNNAALRRYKSLAQELTEMWEALLTLADEIHADEEKLEAVVDGFVSE